MAIHAKKSSLMIAGRVINTPVALQSNTHNFRPLRTEAEGKRDIAVMAIKELLIFDYGDDPKSSAIQIYDAIAAGKIPGVKLED